jgi:hypothetical protein
MKDSPWLTIDLVYVSVYNSLAHISSDTVPFSWPQGWTEQVTSACA